MIHLEIVAYFVLIAVVSVRLQAIEGNSIVLNRFPRQNQRFPQQNGPNSFGFRPNNQGNMPQAFPNQMQFLQGNGLNQPFPQQNNGFGSGLNNQGFQQQSTQFQNSNQNQQFAQQNGFGTFGQQSAPVNQQQSQDQGQVQPFPQQNGLDPFGIASNNQGNQQQQSSQTQSNSNVSTTPSAGQTPGQTPDQSQTTNAMPFILCNRNCLTTNEYSPVCGSDQKPYPNERRLGCVNRCGRRVNPNWQEISIVNQGTCISFNRVA